MSDDTDNPDAYWTEEETATVFRAARKLTKHGDPTLISILEEVVVEDDQAEQVLLRSKLVDSLVGEDNDES